jgi:hypothetical protein
MINSINWIDGLDGLSSGVAFIAAVTLGIISLTYTGRPGAYAAHRRALLRPGRALLGFLRWNFNPASIFTARAGCSSSAITLAVLAILGHRQGRRRAARPRRPDHRHVLDHRPAGHPGPIAVQPDRRTSTTAARPRPVASPDGPRHLRICLALAVLSLLLSGVTQLYAFLGVFVAFGLILFIPTRGDFDRPDELEAEAYEPEVRAD